MTTTTHKRGFLALACSLMTFGLACTGDHPVSTARGGASGATGGTEATTGGGGASTSTSTSAGGGCASSCRELGVACGSWDNGCGESLACGACDAGATCSSDGQCEMPTWTSWPTSANEALARSSFWNPADQIEHQGDYESAADGEVIENLHIVDGSLIITHDNVVVRNVTTDGTACADAGNHTILIESEATGVTLEGIKMGPPHQCWDHDTCNMPMFPASALMARSGSSYTLRACATAHTGDAFKFAGNSGTTTAVIEDCFTEIARGIWAAAACEPDHTDSIQVQTAGADVDVTVRRTWMDALPYLPSDPQASPTQLGSPGGATNLQLQGQSGGRFFYDTVRLHSGNFSLRVNGATIRLGVVNSESLNTTHGPILNAGNVTVEAWDNNRLDNDEIWEAP